MRKAYTTDLSDAEWTCIEAHLPPTPKTTGRPRLHDLREILDAVFYIVRSGCAWRLLPHDLERPGRPSIITFASGASMEPGRSSTQLSAKLSASACACASAEIRNPQ